MERILSTWSGLASHFVGECFDIAKPYLDERNALIDPYVRFVNAQLFIDCHLSSESALILVEAGKEWDGDIITRSVMEGTIKYVFLVLGEPEEVGRKAYEYWELLPDYTSIKRSDRARKFLNAVDNPDSPQWLPFKKLLLTDEVIEDRRNGSNRKERKQLEQKWSFSEIVKGFAVTDSKGLGYLVHLAHGYGMSSHLIHKDGDGVGMVWERYGRSEEDQTAVKLGHSARVVSDICTFAMLRLHHLLKFCGQDPRKIGEVEADYKLLFDELRKAGMQFTETEYGKEVRS